jgi:hypothetical protein
MSLGEPGLRWRAHQAKSLAEEAAGLLGIAQASEDPKERGLARSRAIDLWRRSRAQIDFILGEV